MRFFRIIYITLTRKLWQNSSERSLAHVLLNMRSGILVRGFGLGMDKFDNRTDQPSSRHDYVHTLAKRKVDSVLGEVGYLLLANRIDGRSPAAKSSRKQGLKNRQNTNSALGNILSRACSVRL